jgi:hypothetical protein
MKGGFIIFTFCFLTLLSTVLTAEKDYTDFIKNLQEKIKLPSFKGAAY